jgi:hypothetical protein
MTYHKEGASGRGKKEANQIKITENPSLKQKHLL